MSILLFRLVAILMLLGSGALALVQISSSEWPRTTGIVEKGNWASRDEIVFGSRYRVRYVYDVAGERYTGYRIAFSARTHVVPVAGVKEPRQPREGDEVVVFYAPFYPELSLLVPGASPTLVWWALLSLLSAALLWIVSNVLRDPVF
jgi:hypothetical protein